MDATPEVSVIVPAWNAADVIGAQLDALAAQPFTGSWEVVVVDDGSTDGTADVVERYRDRLPALRIVRGEENRRAGHARNAGVQAATGRSLLFCDADDVVGDGWLASMAVALREHDLVAARMDWSRLNPAWMHRHLQGRQQDGPQLWEINGRAYLPHAGAGTVGLTRALYEEIGPFDERFHNCEGPGPEFCFRAQLAGHELHFVRGAVVHLRLRPTLRGIYRQSRAWAEWTVALEREFAPRGMPRSGWIRGLVSWALVLPRLLLVRGRADLVPWIRRLAWRVGRVRGSIRFRYLAL